MPVSLTPDMGAPMLQRFRPWGKAVIAPSATTSGCWKRLGAGHECAQRGLSPNGVANFAIMLMLMSLRKAGHILKLAAKLQDCSLQGKIGRDILPAPWA
ncbi:MAG: hypothetical protein ACLVJH_12070 [Faecalibacterium prausnitzii]